MKVGAEGCRQARRQALSQGGTDDSGQYVTAPGGGQTGIGRRDEPGRPAGVGHDGGRAFQKHDGIEGSSQGPSGSETIDRSITESAPEPLEFSVVRGENRRLVASIEHGGMGSDDIEPAGIDHQRPRPAGQYRHHLISNRTGRRCVGESGTHHHRPQPMGLGVDGLAPATGEISADDVMGRAGVPTEV